VSTEARRWIQALRTSHDVLVAQVAALTPEALERPSYCRDWDVSQVLSHMGSGNEVALTNLERTLAGAPPLDRAEFPAIWDRWNNLSPTDKAGQMIVWDRRSVSVLQGLDDSTLGSLRVSMFGMDLDATGLVGLRLAEHAVHSWDVAVAFDPGAELLGSSVDLVVDRLGLVVGWTGKPQATIPHRRIEIRTVRPERRFLLSIDDQVSMSEHMGGPTDGALHLPAAALVRLVYGRLDPAHTPLDIKTEGDADLAELRQVFPGV
jgi:uncharacterized protein (TIGR03083 family)